MFKFKTPEEFNTDPKFEDERGVFDSLVEASLTRVIEKKKKDAPPEEKDEENFFDSLFSHKSE